MNASELMEIIQQLAEWHKNRVEAVRLIIDTRDADIELRELSLVIAADSDKAKWLRIGAMLALNQFEKFPVSFGVDLAVNGDSDDE